MIHSRFPWGAYACALLLPLVGLSLFHVGEIGVWLDTGSCPGGPMDRPAAPCGPVEFVAIVLLGGWVAFLIVPLLGIWWFAVTIYFLVASTAKRANGS